jgi:hypothetical protein
MRDLLYFVIGILLGLICIFFDGSVVMAQSTNTAAGQDWLLTEGTPPRDELAENLARAWTHKHVSRAGSKQA